jgi:hypothetical protein
MLRELVKQILLHQIIIKKTVENFTLRKIKKKNALGLLWAQIKIAKRWKEKRMRRGDRYLNKMLMDTLSFTSLIMNGTN